MTRKDYITLADALGHAAPDLLPTPDAMAWSTQWTIDCNAIAVALGVDSGYDLNGNRRFDRERFLSRIAATAARNGR